ncbi:MAG: lipopolysaccharide heptosyltransferase II [Gammaproteobacteria bacterium]
MSVGEKLLVVGPSWVGDMVLAQSLYKLLRTRSPRAVIDVVAPRWSLPLLERMPEVRRGVELAAGHGELALGVRWTLGRRLADERYDRAIVLPRSFKSALVPFFARVPRRTGFLGEARWGLINDIRPFEPERLDQTVKRFVALGLARGETLPERIENPALEVRSASFAALDARLGLSGRGPAVSLMPGAEYGPAKQWPVDRYAELAGRLAAEGLAVWVLGSAKERALGETIAAADAAGRIRNLCGETRLEEAVDVLAASTVAVTNDSGLMHVAAAVGTHVVAIYGSSSPRFTPPMTDARTIVHLGLDCSPCFERRCPLGHLRCLNDIEVAQVLAAALAAVRAREGETRGRGLLREREADD